MKKHLKKHLPKYAGFATIALIGFVALSTSHIKAPIHPHIDSISPTSGPVGTIVTLTGSGFSTDAQNVADYLRIEGKNIGLDQYSEDGGKTIKFTIDLTGTKDAKECIKKINKKGSCKIELKVMDASTKKESNEVHFSVTPYIPPSDVTPTIACTLITSIAPTSPSAQTVSRGQKSVSLVKFNITVVPPNCSININSYAVSLLPMPNGYSNISSLRLYNDADGSLIVSIPTVVQPGLNFSGINVPILPNQTLTLSVVGDISPSATIGSSVYAIFGGSSATDSLGGVVGNNAGTIIPGSMVTIGN